MSKDTRPTQGDEIREEVRRGYGRIARESQQSCCSTTSCCDPASGTRKISEAIGYSDDELGTIPKDADLGLGCGNPTALAEIRPGDVVVDLGSGAGIDCFLAARATGPEGRVIGVDMTDEMLERAKRNADEGGFTNVEFRKGYIEELPVEDSSVDLIISNCVINLSPDKAKVFGEAHRVLRPGGRMVVSDIVLTRSLPQEIINSMEAYVGCVGGASVRSDYLETIRAAGLEVEILSQSNYGQAIGESTLVETAQRLSVDHEEAVEVAKLIVSMKFRAVKPKNA